MTLTETTASTPRMPSISKASRPKYCRHHATLIQHTWVGEVPVSSPSSSAVKNGGLGKKRYAQGRSTVLSSAKADE